MEALAWIIGIFFCMQFMVALSNLLISERMRSGNTSGQPLVSILVPARNEEKNIAGLIDAILKQNYSNFELIVCDDQSQDKTAAIVRQFAQHDQRIQLIRAEELPDGWLGKNSACHILAKHAKGSYYLYLDADVRIFGSIITRAVSHMHKHKLALISIFPKQIMLSNDEKKTIPVMNYILLTLLPLFLVRISSFSSLAAANGQFMFFNAEDYQAIEPHQVLRNNKVEDIAIARLLKKRSRKISCQTGDEDVNCRMYSNYAEAVNGFSRNIQAYFGGSVLLAFIFWLLTTFGILFIFWQLKLSIALTALAIYVFTRLWVAIKSGERISDNFRYLFQQQWAMGVFIIASIKNKYKKDQQWKGRNIII